MLRHVFGPLRASATLLAAAGLVLVAGCGDDEGATGPDNQDPEVQITAPPDNSTFAVNEEVVFRGSATDPEDGNLTGDALVWTTQSGLVLGQGEEIAVSDLSVGVHTITLTATDSDFGRGSASITVTIAQEPGQE